MNLEAYPGEKILPKWQELRSWIFRQKHRVYAPEATITYTPTGAVIVANPPEYFQQIRFRVNLVGGTPAKVTVGDGTINGMVPRVNGVLITGTKTPPQPPPEIPLVSPNSEGVCLVCIKTTHAGNGTLTAATIESRIPEELPGGMRADYGAGSHGFIPIALVRHNLQTRQPESVYQHSVHNLQVRMYDSGQGRRVIYWAA